MTGERQTRLSTPMVLAASSGMVALGIAMWIGAAAPEAAEREQEGRAARATMVIDDRTPERVAESYYDAWRRRRWSEAAGISVGPAREAAMDKQARDERLDHTDRVVAERAWELLARAPLEVIFDESEDLPDGGLALRGTAEYELLDRPYRRRVEFVVQPRDGAFRVERMRLGEVLTDLPDLLRGGGVGLPRGEEPRGEEQ